jgi:RimJ/RimL family protein N-acetyltransferase
VITIRPATADDSQIVWEWSNDPTVRAVSFQSSPIPWDGHERWFQEKLTDPLCRFFIIVDNERPVGQLRFEMSGDAAEAHISVSAGERGRGCGAEALRLGCGAIRAAGPLRRVIARIKPDNQTSIQLFARAGFVDAGAVDVVGQPARQMVFDIQP